MFAAAVHAAMARIDGQIADWQAKKVTPSVNEWKDLFEKDYPLFETLQKSAESIPLTQTRTHTTSLGVA